MVETPYEVLEKNFRACEERLNDTVNSLWRIEETIKVNEIETKGAIDGVRKDIDGLRTTISNDMEELRKIVLDMRATISGKEKVGEAEAVQPSTSGPASILGAAPGNAHQPNEAYPLTRKQAQDGDDEGFINEDGTRKGDKKLKMEMGSEVIVYYDVPIKSLSTRLPKIKGPKIKGAIYPTRAPTFRYNYRDDLYEFTNIAIEYYNSNHQNGQFELVDPLCLTVFTSSSYFRGGPKHHLSFIAKRKKTSELKHFFAAFLCPKIVEICSTVEPGNPLFQVGCGVCHHDGAMYHTFMKGKMEYVGGRHSSVVYSGKHLSNREAAAKKFLREAYTIESKVEDLDAEDAYELKQTIDGHAMMALDKFNSENGVLYKFLETISCTRFVCEAFSWAGVFWAHLIFKAEGKDLIDPVFFFAEVGFDIVTINCVVVPSTGSDLSSGNKSRCVVCPSNIFHPVGGCIGGHIAGSRGGAFADSLHEGHFRGVKSKLLQKDDEAYHVARNEFYKSLEED